MAPDPQPDPPDAARPSAAGPAASRSGGVPAPRTALLQALTLGGPLRCSVVVHGTTVPSGGMLTFSATGFRPAASLDVRVTGSTRSIARFPLDRSGATSGLTRVPLPAVDAPRQHLLQFSDGHHCFDLLVRVLPCSAVVRVSPRVVEPGSPVQFDGSGFPPGGVLSVKFHHDGDPHEYEIDVDGTISGHYHVPTTADHGEQDLIFLAANPATVARAAVTVL